MSEQPVLVQSHYRARGGGGGSPPPAAGPAPGAGAPADPAAPAPGGFFSQRMAGLPVWAWTLIAGGVAVGAFLWFRRGQSGTKAASTAAANQAASTSATSTGCYDSGGNSVPCSGADYAGQIAALQAEIDNMQGGASTPTGTTGAASTLAVSVPSVTGDSTTQAKAVLQSAGLPAAVQGSGTTVTSQSPGAGSTVTAGTTVTLST